MNVLADSKVVNVLNALHREAELDRLKRAYQKKNKIVDARFLETAYLSIKPAQGKFLYCLATIAGAKNIVEYGCSFGVSSIYLASAAKCNLGHLISTDIEVSKVDGTIKNIEAAGLSPYATVLQGDALVTLDRIEDPIDFLFLDGANEHYLSIFELLYPRFSRKAIVVADNANKGGASSYVSHVKQRSEEFTNISFFEDRMLVSYRV